MSGIVVTKVFFHQKKTGNTGGEWQGRSGFSRNFCPVVTMAEPRSSALQTLGDTFSTWAAAPTEFRGNVAGWNRAWGVPLKSCLSCLK